MPDKNKKTEKKTDSSLLDQTSAISSTDFTGLIPALPVDSSELHSYAELYPFLPAYISKKLDQNEKNETK